MSDEAPLGVWERLATLEDERNALQLAFVALAVSLVAPVTPMLRSLSLDMTRKQSPKGAALLSSMACAIETLADQPTRVQ